MKFNNWREFVFVLMMLSSILWFILTFVAMMFYSGGTYVNPNSPGYDFFSNYNSDLGRTIAHSGRPNTISYVFFTINHIIFSVSLILFFVAIYNFFKEKSKEKWLALAGTIGGVFTGINFFLIVFFPSDLYSELHSLFNSIGFLTLVFVVIFLAVAIYFNDDYPNRYSFVNLIYVVIVGLYLVILFTGPSRETAEGLRVQVTCQKLVLFAGIINILYQGNGAWKLEQSSSSNI